MHSPHGCGNFLGQLVWGGKSTGLDNKFGWPHGDLLVTLGGNGALLCLTSVLDARLESRHADVEHSLAIANAELTTGPTARQLTKLPNRPVAGRPHSAKHWQKVQRKANLSP